MNNPWGAEAGHFRGHIEEATDGLLKPDNFNLVVAKTVETRASACIDKFCEKGSRGSGEFPASVIGITNEQGQDTLYRELRDAGAVDLDAYIHLHCGYLFTYLNLVTLNQQKEYVDIMKSEIEREAMSGFGIHVNFLDGGEHGTAEPFMN